MYASTMAAAANVRERETLERHGYAAGTCNALVALKRVPTVHYSRACFPESYAGENRRKTT